MKQIEKGFPMMRFLVRRIVLLLVVLPLTLMALAVVQIIVVPPQVQSMQQSSAQAVGPPESCQIGFYLDDLYDLNIVNKTFTADFWVWSLCADGKRSPLETMEFLNASSITSSLDAIEQKKGIYWEYKKVTGVFRHNWDVSSYPFDRHLLHIVVEESADDTSSFIYVPQTKLSDYNHDMHLAGWKINDLQLNESEHFYHTTFGDPTLKAGQGSTYTQIQVNIALSRAEYTSFLKIMAPVYIAFAIVLLTFFLLLDTSQIIALLTGALFVIVINMQQTSAALGSNAGLTLVDMLHIVALLGVLAVAAILVLSHVWHKESQSIQQIERLNRRSCALLAALFVVVNVVLIVTANLLG